jgi:hypothetical protein
MSDDIMLTSAWRCFDDVRRCGADEKTISFALLALGLGLLAVAYLFVKDVAFLLGDRGGKLSSVVGSVKGRGALVALLFIAARAASVLLGPGMGDGAMVSAVRVAAAEQDEGYSTLSHSISLHFAAAYLFYFMYYRTVWVVAESSSLIDAPRSDSRRVLLFYQMLPYAHIAVTASAIAGWVLVGLNQAANVSLVLIVSAFFKLLTILIGAIFAWETQQIGSNSRNKQCCGLLSMVWFLCPFLEPTSHKRYLQHQRKHNGMQGNMSKNNAIAGVGSAIGSADSEGGVELVTASASKGGSRRSSTGFVAALPRQLSTRKQNNGLMANLNHLLSPGQRQELKKQTRIRNIVTSLHIMTGVMFAQTAVDIYVASIVQLHVLGETTEVRHIS